MLDFIIENTEIFNVLGVILTGCILLVGLQAFLLHIFKSVLDAKNTQLKNELKNELKSETSDLKQNQVSMAKTIENLREDIKNGHS